MNFKRIKKRIVFKQISHFILFTLLVITLCITGYGNLYKLNAEEYKEKRSQTITKQYVFFYMMKKDLKKDVNEIKKVVQEHIKYWHDNKLENYSGGPFSDRSGGMISFNADSINTAEELAMNDPFVINDLIETKWIKEWMKE
ncbi:MAG: hypothetical protein JEZ12_15420 [Desulfobacterium sp.]|nr:hypothetical protein [Desulfobacterium sp.]